MKKSLTRKVLILNALQFKLIYASNSSLLYIYIYIAPVQGALCFCRYKSAVGIVEKSLIEPGSLNLKLFSKIMGQILK